MTQATHAPATAAGSMNVEPGVVLAGKYRVERVLGQGGMGYVVAARDLQLDRRVAVKFLLPEVLGVPDAAARFLREARASVRIQNEHVVRVIDVGTLETGAPYMVMEYLEGSDLGALVQQRGVLPVSEAADYVIQACAALAEAHASGIVHRDIKPANLFLAKRAGGSSMIKVLDFGISKVTQAGDAGLTKTSSMMGSPLYMSPEQMKNAKDVDARADQWALGCILYELTTGTTPFLGESIPQICAAILAQEPPPPSSHRPELPAEFEGVVMRCLRKTPEERFADVADLTAALVPFASTDVRASAAQMSHVLQAAGMRASQVELPAAYANAPFGATAGAATAPFGGRTAADYTAAPATIQSAPAALTSAASRTGAGTAGAWSETGEVPVKRGAPIGLLVGGAVALVAAGAAAALLVGRADAPAAAASEAPPPAVASTAKPVVEPEVTATPTVAASVAAASAQPADTAAKPARPATNVAGRPPAVAPPPPEKPVEKKNPLSIGIK
ncbi:MAG: serine/threonine protein kinase [Polyangiaceae bacterium]|nr:serine/threonine protein kinase [Polyangiaceae bacterium]